jgi:LPXTG-motif cell wall-anchored protein
VRVRAWRSGLASLALVSGIALVGSTSGVAGAEASGGTWTPGTVIASPLPHVRNLAVTAISCSSPGNCAAVGSLYGLFLATSSAFVQSEVHGQWQPAIPVGGNLDSGYGAGLNAVSCPSDGNCVAGGSYQSNAGGKDQGAFVVSEVAGVWDTTGIPVGDNVDTGHDGSIDSIACTSAGNCVAVGTAWQNASPGTSVTGMLVTDSQGTWDPKASVLAGPSVDRTKIQSVACVVGGTTCIVGGMYFDAQNHQLAFVDENASAPAGAWPPITELVASENVGQQAQVNAVACSRDGHCGAGGSYTNGGGLSVAFVAHDASWATVASPISDSPSNSSLQALSCSADQGTCAAGGTEDGHGFVADESSGAWTSTSRATSIVAVSCGSPHHCAAVGYLSDQPPLRQPYAVSQASAGGWTPGGTLNASSEDQSNINVGSQSGLVGVSCPSLRWCVAAGTFFSGRGPQPFATELSSGTWQDPGTTLGTNLPGTDLASPAGISCPSAGSCGITGTLVNPVREDLPFVASEVAGTWDPTLTVVDLPSGTSSATMTGISCPSPGSCVAVGNAYSPSGSNVPFYVLETQGTWDPHPVAVPGLSTATGWTGWTGNLAVSCPRLGECTLVGSASAGSSGVGFTYEETHGHWAATANVVSDPLGSLSLADVSCTSPGSCSAVGYLVASGTSVDSNYAIDEVDGRWLAGHVVDAPPSMQSSLLGFVRCWAPGECVAAGQATSGAGGGTVVAVEHRSAWAASTLLAPSTATSRSYPADLSCSPDGTCSLLVTLLDNLGIGIGATSIYDFAAGSWSSTSSLSMPDTYFGSISCTTQDFCQAVGYAALVQNLANLKATAIAKVDGRWQRTTSTVSIPGVLGLLSPLSCTGPFACGVTGVVANDFGFEAVGLDLVPTAPSPTTTTPSNGGGRLPATGSDARSELVLAGILVAAGLLATGVRRRSRRSTASAAPSR